MGNVLPFDFNNYGLSEKFQRKLIRLVPVNGIELPEIPYLTSENQERNP